MIVNLPVHSGKLMRSFYFRFKGGIIMKIKDWFIAKKEKRTARRLAKQQEKLERSLGADLHEIEPFEPDTEDIEQPETRFTEEYREFLKREAEIAARDSAGRAVKEFEADRAISDYESEKD